MNTSNTKGIKTELEIILKFIELGYSVSIPYGNNNRYDLILDIGDKLNKVQCKTSRHNKNNSYTINTSNTITNRNISKTKYYTPDQIDCIASIIEGNLIIINVLDVYKVKQKVFRITTPLKSNTTKVNLIEDFTLDRFLKES